MSEESNTIETDMKWDVLLSAVGMKCEGNALKMTDGNKPLFAGIKNPKPPTPPYSPEEKAQVTDGTNPNSENPNTTGTNTSKGE